MSYVCLIQFNVAPHNSFLFFAHLQNCREATCTCQLLATTNTIAQVLAAGVSRQTPRRQLTLPGFEPAALLMPDIFTTVTTSH